MRTRPLAALLLSAVMAAGLTLPAAALGPMPGRQMSGMDVSVYQGEIDFSAVKDSGVEAVYIRAGYGADKVDRYFQRNAEGAARAGLHFGFYWYVTARTEDEARRQAAAFASVIRGTGYDCRPAMDFENYTGLPNAQVNAIGRAFQEELSRQTGTTPLLYTDASAAERVWDAGMGAYPLWAAEYGPSEPRIEGSPWTAWAGFQYSDSGRVPGIRAAVDLDRFTPGVLLEEDEGGHAAAPADPGAPAAEHRNVQQGRVPVPPADQAAGRCLGEDHALLLRQTQGISAHGFPPPFPPGFVPLRHTSPLFYTKGARS